MFEHDLSRTVSTTDSTAETTSQSRLHARFAKSEKEILAAQTLRYNIFSQEYGAAFYDQNGAPTSIDSDHYDPHCRHLMVLDGERIVGYTRLLPGAVAKKIGGFYSAHEFDIDGLVKEPHRFLEIGRTCVHPDYRNGATIAVLWSKLAEFLVESGFDYLIGCASVPLGDGGSSLNSVMPMLRKNHLADKRFRVAPKVPYLTTHANGSERPKMPPLLKAYMRMGAQICGEPCWDQDFNCADLFIFLDVALVADRYAKRFLSKVVNS